MLNPYCNLKTNLKKLNMRPKRKFSDEDEVNTRRTKQKINDSTSEEEQTDNSSDSDYVDEVETTEDSSETIEETETSSNESKSAPDSVSRDSDSEDDKNTDFIESRTLKNLKIANPQLHSKFEEIYNEIKRTEPEIINVASSNLQLKDKVKLFQLFEIYKNCYPSSHDWLDTRNQFNKTLREATRNQAEYERYSIEEHKTMETQVAQLEKKISNSMFQLKYKILNLQTTEENKAVIYRKFLELQNTNRDDSEYSKLTNWLNNVIEMPFDKVKIFSHSESITRFLQFAYQKMNQELYGMKKVKEQLLFFINAKLTNPNMKRTNLGLVSKPGMGKTSIARLLSSILDIGFEQISCGGVDRSDFFKGHDYTYVGSRPGEIVNCLKRMGTKNGILFFDEYEKVLSNKSISALMLHITDPAQNSEFRDNYFSELTIDLSAIWFIYSMNSLPKDEALRDRIFYIEIEDYSLREKITIVRDFILPKTLFNSGLNKNDIVFDTETIKYLVNQFSNEKGLRTLEKIILDIVNKLKFLELNQDDTGNLQFDFSFKINRKVSFPFEVNLQTLKCLVQFEENVDKLMLSLYV